MKVSDVALKKIYDLICEEGDLSLKLRVFVVGGGCAGFQYGFNFDTTTHDDDTIIRLSVGTDQSIALVIDPFSVQYLNTAEIEYKDDHFVIRNPTVRTTCSCGGTFQEEVEK